MKTWPIFILSGKGGVGKSTVAVNLATSLALSGKKVGLLDIDFHGPSVPQMLNLSNVSVPMTGEEIIPVTDGKNLKVMSIGFALDNADSSVIWRGPLKARLIKQFLGNVQWGALDYLIVDSPPGTGDEPLSLAQLIPHPDGAIIVTTPQLISINDVRRCVGFCKRMNLKVIGVIENMSGFVCPNCGEITDIFKIGGGRQMSDYLDIPFLGSIPLEKDIVSASDEGKPFILHYPGTMAAHMFNKIIENILN